MKNSIATTYGFEWKSWMIVFILGILFSTIVLAQEEDVCETAGHVLLIAAKDANCVGENSGSATIASTGCSCIYSGCLYLWSDGQEYHTAFDLAAGTYSVTVTHPDGCIMTEEVEVKQPEAFISEVMVDNAKSCSEGGRVQVIPTDNAGPLTFEWSNGETTAEVSDLENGTYTVNVTNFVGCKYTEVFEIQGEIAEVEVDAYDSCEGENNGRAVVSINGGTEPYSFLWNDPSNCTEATAMNLAPGEYQVFITDASNCTYEASVVIGETLPNVQVSANKNDICPFEEVELTAIGGVSFEWQNVEGNKNARILKVTPSETTTYGVAIETETGCITHQLITVAVVDGPRPNIIAPVTAICEGGEAQLIATDNSGANFSWSPTEGLSNPNGNVTLASPSSTTTYTLSATNHTGCTTTTEITIEVSDCVTTGIEDWVNKEGISLFPNPNRGIFQLQFELQEAKTIHLQLYNAIGQILEGTVYEQGSGNFLQQFDLSQQATGLYYLEIEIEGERHLEKIMIY